MTLAAEDAAWLHRAHSRVIHKLYANVSQHQLPSDLAKRIKQALDGKVREGQVKPKDSVQLTDFYEQAMRGYTYLGSE